MYKNLKKEYKNISTAINILKISENCENQHLWQINLWQISQQTLAIIRILSLFWTCAGEKALSNCWFQGEHAWSVCILKEIA